MNRRLVVAGGGFAGLWAALAAKRELTSHSDVDVCLVTKDPYLTLRPRLYEADPSKMRVPLEATLNPVGIGLTIAEVDDIDPQSRQLITGEGALLYDRLVLATGSQQQKVPIPGIDHCLSVDDYEGAIRLDERLKELAREPSEGAHIVIIGAGFTGIELATELRSRLADLNQTAAERIGIFLLDSAEEVGPELGANPRPEIERALTDARVELRLGVSVKEIQAKRIELEGGEIIPVEMVVNCTGLEANPLTRCISDRLDGKGRLLVDEQLRVEGINDVFAAGDSALARTDEAGHYTLLSCQHALATGRFAGYNAASDLLDRPGVPYRQDRYLTCLDLGASGAVVTQGWDREVMLTGEDANQLKRDINTAWIYPPTGSAEEILAQAGLPEESTQGGSD